MTRSLPHPDDEVALARALAVVRARLQAIADDCNAAQDPVELPVAAGSALERICTAFRLSPFETAVLLLAVGIELSPGLDALCAGLTGGEPRPHPTLGLALAAFPGGHWDAFLPQGPLRRHRLIQLGAGDVLTQRPVRVEERVLHALLGHRGLDARLASRASVGSDPGPLPPSHEAVAQSLVSIDGLVHLWASDIQAAVYVAARAAASAGWQAWVTDASSIPADPAEREELLRLWSRDLQLESGVLVVTHESGAPGTEAPLVDFLVRLEGRRMVVARESVAVNVPLVRRWVEPLPFQEKLALWQDALGPAASVPDTVIRDLSAQFNLGPAAIRSVAGELRRSSSQSPREVRNVLWRACRGHARPRMADLAQRVEVRSNFDRLVLPSAQRDMLAALIGQVRCRSTVYHAWGFAEIDGRSAGTSAVFSGPSGTGKTMAAEAIAADLDLDLYRIDLSAVVSKYIGETEENLRKVFDAAEAGGSILLFDEADALFGKRTEVRDSHDRHANIEVSYLLQRMEAYSGLAILTTNLRKSMDDAFLRRVQFIVEFPFPDAGQREQIWRHIFPAQTPQSQLDYSRLARLSVTGGNIRSIARNAAYIAANREQSVGMTHLLVAARLEYAKLGRSLAPSETRGWE